MPTAAPRTAALLAAGSLAALAVLAWRARRRNSARPLPAIDISRFLHGTAAERAAVAAEWDAAFVGAGFVLLRGFESLLPAASVRRLRSAARAFFEQPAEVKMRAHADGVVGYVQRGAENVGATLGDAASVPDLVESLNLSGYQEEAMPWSSSAETMNMPWRGTSYEAALPRELSDAIEAYWRGATALMLALMELSELALDLPVGHFREPFAEPGTLLRLAYYPPGRCTPGQMRYAAHTDYDGFTLLERGVEGAAPGGGGLELRDHTTGDWVPVPAPEGTLTINIGDLLARWTNDRWRAGTHRVPAPAGDAAESSRLSVVYFTGPHPQTTVECLPSAKCGRGAAPKYPPISAEEHVQEKLRKAVVA